MSREEVIDQYFKLFKLDRRASKEELEIAYEVLTVGANISTEEIQGYRLAFEYLMFNYFNVSSPVKEEDKPNDLEELATEEFKQCIKTMPAPIKDALDYIDKRCDFNLSEISKIIWATQSINLPMLFRQIDSNKHKLFNFTWWTHNDMKEVLKKSVFNPLEFRTTTFEMTDKENTKDISTFVNGLYKLFSKTKPLCPVFDISKTEFGTMGYVIIEKDLNKQLVAMLHTKASQFNYSLNLVTQEELEQNDEL
jgi:hypothetical protein